MNIKAVYRNGVVFLKKIVIFFIILSSILLMSCADDSIQELDLNKNMIYPRELTASEKELLSLVGFNQTIEIFDFETKKSFKSISIWLEVYEDGKLLENRSKMSSSYDSEKGSIAIKVIKDGTFDWRVSIKTNGNVSSMAFESKDDFLKDKSYSVASSHLEDKKIENEEAIVLKTFLFDSSGSTSIYGLQYYEEHPEALREYDYAYLLKAKFSENESSDGQLENVKEDK